VQPGSPPSCIRDTDGAEHEVVVAELEQVRNLLQHEVSETVGNSVTTDRILTIGSGSAVGPA
jgi:hypothetical protein